MGSEKFLIKPGMILIKYAWRVMIIHNPSGGTWESAVRMKAGKVALTIYITLERKNCAIPASRWIMIRFAACHVALALHLLLSKAASFIMAHYTRKQSA